MKSMKTTAGSIHQPPKITNQQEGGRWLSSGSAELAASPSPDHPSRSSCCFERDGIGDHVCLRRSRLPKTEKRHLEDR